MPALEGKREGLAQERDRRPVRIRHHPTPFLPRHPTKVNPQGHREAFSEGSMVLPLPW